MAEVHPLDHLQSRTQPDGTWPSNNTTSEPTPHPNTNVEIEPPDGGYGWVCVVCYFLINAHTWGINASYSVFLAYYLKNNTFPKATYLEYAAVGGLSIGVALGLSPIATSVTRVYGIRVTLLTGVFGTTASLIGASFATEIWHLFLTQGVFFGVGMGFLFVGCAGIIPQWFLKRRGVASGIVAGGSGIGGLMYSLAAHEIIERHGVAWAFRVLAGIQLVVNFACAMFMRDRNQQIGTRNLAFHYPLFKRPEFLLYLAWGVFSMLGYVVLLFSLPDYAASIGLTAKEGAVVGALLSLGTGLGRPVVGYFSDTVGHINMTAWMTFLTGVLCLSVWIVAGQYGSLIVFAISVGIVCGTIWTMVAPIGTEVVGLADLPSGLSIMWIVLVLPATFAEPIGLALRDRAEKNIYLPAQIFTGLMYLVATLCLLYLRAWKIRELDILRKRSSRGEAPGLSTMSIDTPRLHRRMFSWQKV
ncbi:MAG: hypothetical protein M1816_005279 [Peltula sp. TS41687]|nr:MAG: hypothetical protein M1816_005279 [Peltula sp. TS41687]